MYTKLANCILTSTVWMESNETRIVWLTLLAMCDKHGEVLASIPGLANVARVSVQDCETAIQLFLSPDPYSRTKTDEGRRLEVIDGGWFVINHRKYRDHASDTDVKQKAAERQRRYRERQKRNGQTVTSNAKTVTSNARNGSGCDKSHPISHTDTDTDTDTEAEANTEADVKTSISSEPDKPASKQVVELRPEDCKFPVFPCSGKGPKTWEPTESQIKDWEESYPAVDVRQQLRESWQWIKNNLANRKSYGGYPAYVNRWFARNQDRGGRSNGNGRGSKPLDSRNDQSVVGTKRGWSGFLVPDCEATK